MFLLHLLRLLPARRCRLCSAFRFVRCLAGACFLFALGHRRDALDDLQHLPLRQIISEGQQRGQIRDDVTANEISKLYAVCERGLMYDWCISSGNYSLCQYSASMLPLFLEGLCK